MKKKVLFIITKSNWGGAQRYVFDLATALPPETFEVVVALGGTGSKGAETGQLEQELRAHGIRTIFVKSFIRGFSIGKDVQVFFELWKLCRVEKPAIVHLNSSKAVVAGAIAAKCAGVPRVIATVHGWAFNEARPRWQRFILKSLHWSAAVICTRTITVSLFDAEQSRGWLFVSRKIIPIHNGIASFSPMERAAARTYLSSFHAHLSGHSDALWIGTISELHRNKGIDVLLEALSRLPNAEKTICVIIGSGEEKEYLEKRAVSLGVAEKVFFLGFIPNASQYLQAFDVFTLLSKKEGLPYVLLEAGIAKVAIVANRVGGIPEIIDSEISGILTVLDDTTGVIKAIAKLSGDQELRKHYGEELEKKVKEEFSLERMRQETFALY